MIDMHKRHEIQVLRRADHTWSEIAALSGVSEKTARRIAAEDPVTSIDNAAERTRRQVGRASKADAGKVDDGTPPRARRSLHRSQHQTAAQRPSPEGSPESRSSRNATTLRE